MSDNYVGNDTINENHSFLEQKQYLNELQAC